jgi:hypothetical protein
MVAVLESHLSLLEQEANTPSATNAAERTAFVEDVIALHLAVFEAMERHLGADGLTESHRFMVPLYRRWIHSARLMIVTARDLKAAGVTIHLDPLLSAINRAKPVAEDFDHFVELNQRLDRGQAGSYRPLAEVVDELRSRTQQPR